MSVPSRAPRRFRPGAAPPHRRWGRFLAHVAGAAVALGLALVTGSTAAHAATATTPLHTYYVAPSGTDTSGSCTANTAHNAFPTIAAGLACAVSGDSIRLAPTGTAPYQGFGTVSQNITISAKSGANARTVVVDATTASNLTVAAGATVTLTGVTIDGSNDPATPDVTNNGTLTLARDAITNNLVNGGIDSFGTGASLTLNASTVSGNTGGEGGGGINIGGGTALAVNNSTIASNVAGSTVGGVDLNPESTGTFVNSTITGNQGDGVVGGLQVWGGATATLSNTIIAGNTGGSAFPDCHGVLTDGPGGHNLIGDPSTDCTGLTNNLNGDQLDVSAGLLPLANNGGPTDTAALVASSPAVGAGNPATCSQAPVSGKDQRGDSRKAATRGCDIGAYDTAGKVVSLHTYYVAPNGTDTSGSCTANTAHNAFPTIAAGLACAVTGDVISLAPTGATPYQGFGTVSQDITISATSGANARTVVVDATNSSNLTVAPGGDLLLTGVTIDGSNDVASPDVTNNGALTLTRDAITDNVVSSGIVSDTTGAANAGLRLYSSTVSGNVGGEGGGGINIGAGTALAVNNSTIANNLAGSTVGGVDLNPGAIGTFVNSTITGNQDAPVGGLQVWAGASATLSNTIIAGNTGDSYSDCHGVLTDGSGGHNLIGNATGCTGLANGVNGDQLNVPAPGLGSLANNGGPTDTAALATGSPAIGAGNATTCEQGPIGDVDQRGDSRNASTRGGCDVGAYDTGGTS
jgi:hypothetical protein